MQHGETISVNETHGTASSSVLVAPSLHSLLHENSVLAISWDDYYNCTLQINRNCNRMKLDQPPIQAKIMEETRERERETPMIFFNKVFSIIR